MAKDTTTVLIPTHMMNGVGNWLEIKHWGRAKHHVFKFHGPAEQFEAIGQAIVDQCRQLREKYQPAESEEVTLVES